MTAKFGSRKLSIMQITGITAAILYCILTALSITYFPGPFSPLDNFLSQLGNTELNPRGAIFYNLAIIQTGIMAIPFYIGLNQWYTKRTGEQLSLFTRISGIINGLAITFSGVFPESGNFVFHVVFSYLIFTSFVPILIGVNKSLLSIEGYNRIICYYGFAVAGINLVLIFAVTLMFMGYGQGIGPIMEWLAVFTYFGWAVLLAINA